MIDVTMQLFPALYPDLDAVTLISDFDEGLMDGSQQIIDPIDDDVV